MSDHEVSWDAITRSEVSRRAFLTRMTAAGLGGAAMALLAGCGSGSEVINLKPNPSPTPTPTGFDPVNFPGIVGRNENEVVLNYALTLEILEADLYRQALNKASGRAATAALDPTSPASGLTGSYSLTVGNGAIASGLSGAAFLYLVQYAYVEAAHRDFLKVVLGSLGAPIAAANPHGYTASFGSDLSSIMNVIYTVEEEGTRAYLGAAGFMTDSTLLTNAAAIYSTECRHASAVAYVLGKDPGPVFMGGGDTNVIDGNQSANPSPYGENTFQYFRKPTQVLSDVAPFIVS